MIRFLSTIIVIAFLLTISQKGSAQTTFLDVGETVDTYPDVKWLKGSPISHFNKDSIYVVELWATWCKPCMEVMPHINAMSKKFRGKISFIAQNVMEDDMEKVMKFVADNNTSMDFNIAFSGPEGSSFDKNWIKPSATRGIPRTFVIQNNTLIWMTHPLSLNEDVLQLIIDKKFTIQGAMALQNKKK